MVCKSLILLRWFAGRVSLVLRTRTSRPYGGGLARSEGKKEMRFALVALASAPPRQCGQQTIPWKCYVSTRATLDNDILRVTQLHALPSFQLASGRRILRVLGTNGGTISRAGEFEARESDGNTGHSGRGAKQWGGW